MSPIVAALLPVGVSLVVVLIPLFLKRSKTKAVGKAGGRFVTNFFGQKMGVNSWNKLENRLQTTASDLAEGFMEGLNEDD